MAIIELRRRALVWLADYERTTGARHADVLHARRQIMRMSEPQLERFLEWLESRGAPLSRNDAFADVAGHHTFATPFALPGGHDHSRRGRVRFSFPAQTP